jgi:3'-phosphoadenosine 5'-phosphosulfate sulfotransferase (PAPS reductase)/FAD synthetase
MMTMPEQMTFDRWWNEDFDWQNPDHVANDTWGLGCEFIELDNPKNWQSKEKTEAEKLEMSRRGKAREAGMRCDYYAKMDFTVRCLRRALQRLPLSQWCLSWSAGNDSTALSCVLRNVMKMKVHHIMSNTRLEYPETIRNMHAYKKVLESEGVGLTIAYPDKRPMEVWAEDGIPLFSKEITSKYRQWISTGNDNHLKRVPPDIREAFVRLRDKGIMLTDKCCDELKKKPMRKVHKAMGFKGSFTGVRASESQARKLAYLQRGALYYSSRNRQWICNPIVHWSESDVQRCLKENGVELERPGNGQGRSGCINCGFGCHIEQKAGKQNSLQILSVDNPQMWSRTMVDWKFQEACDVAGIKTRKDQ